VTESWEDPQFKVAASCPVAGLTLGFLERAAWAWAYEIEQMEVRYVADALFCA
jgi:hypothetical protein